MEKDKRMLLPCYQRYPRLLPWAFADAQTELKFYKRREEQWTSAGDALLVFPWAMLWVSIIARHWSSLPYKMILRSFLHFSIVIGPAYWQRILSKATYARWRNFIVAAALLSYTFHPGGGLYRDAVMINAAEHTGLSAAHLFVRLLVGSRTLFWLILVFGYELPPLLGIPLNALCLTIMAYTKGSAPFCSTMQTASTQPLFHYIAASIPLVSIIPMAHPELAEGADICNPLVRWLVIVLAFLLPTAVQLATDYSARKTFARQNPWLLSPADRTVWLDPAKGEGSAASVALVTYVHLSTALWYVLMWGQLMPAATALAGFRAVQMS